jgi:hypothetical protein
MRLLNFNSFIKENLSENKIEDYIKKIKQEIEENSNDISFIYEYSNPSENEWIINFLYDEIPYRYEIDVLNSKVVKFIDGSIDFDQVFKSIEECFSVVKKDIFNLFKTNESKVGRPKSARTKSGRKIPGKYLTRNRKLMKKEIEKFQGKNIYKKDWDADYKSGKGGEGNRWETKKSAATIAYQKKYGKK